MILWLLSFIPGVGPFLAMVNRNPWIKRALDFAAVILIGLVVIVVFVRHERHIQAAKDEAARAAALAESDKRDREAQTNAALERQADAAQVAAVNEELSHADDATADSRPSDARRAFLCGVLRHQAGRGAALPTECGPSGSAGAAAHR